MAGTKQDDGESTPNAKEPPASAKARAAKGKRRKTRAGGKKSGTGSGPPKRLFPKVPLERALRIPIAIKDKNGGNPWEPAEIAKVVGLSVKGVDFFYLAGASRDHGLTDGGRDSKKIALTELGRGIAYAPNKAEEDLRKRQAFEKVSLFKRVLDYYKGSDLPEMKYLGNTLENEFGIPPDLHDEFAKLFRQNCQYLGITAGSVTAAERRRVDSNIGGGAADRVVAEADGGAHLTCFVIMPFTEKGSNRPEGYFDEVLKHVIAPAGKKAGFDVRTADRRGSDVIHTTIIRSLLDADLVLADLTDHNPNVLFELGVRMTVDKPVALIRASGTGKIFDVDNLLRVYDYNPNLWPSTVDIDVDEIANHIKGSWDNRDSIDTYMKILSGQATTTRTP